MLFEVYLANIGKSRIFCHPRYSQNLGRYSSGIKLKNGSLYLDYTYGDICPDGYNRKSTNIIFICKAGAKVRNNDSLRSYHKPPTAAYACYIETVIRICCN